MFRTVTNWPFHPNITLFCWSIPICSSLPSHSLFIKTWAQTNSMVSLSPTIFQGYFKWLLLIHRRSIQQWNAVICCCKGSNIYLYVLQYNIHFFLTLQLEEHQKMCFYLWIRSIFKLITKAPRWAWTVGLGYVLLL